MPDSGTMAFPAKAGFFLLFLHISLRVKIAFEHKGQTQELKQIRVYFSHIKRCKGFPGGAVVENLPANAGDTGSSPGLGRSHMPRSN